MKRLFSIAAISLCFIATAFANQKILNLYIWDQEVPDAVIKKFETETGIKVNYATYDSNEVLYAKMKASPNSGYDLIQPSNYYVERMRNEGMLLPIDKSQLSNYHNIDTQFANPEYDPNNNYNVPYVWTGTGIFVNKKYYDPTQITAWKTFWNKKYNNQLMLLDDPREVFSIGLMSLGFSPNDTKPDHIKAAFEQLKKLLPNVKLFNSSAIPSIFIDEDATLGMAWNGDIYRAAQENPNLIFIYPNDGFVISVDCFAIPKNAPHVANALKFLDFMLRPENAKQVTLLYGYPSVNAAARAMMPKNISTNPTIFPVRSIMQQGHFQRDVSDQSLRLLADYWETLKLNA